MNYDVIGDIHGQHDRLVALLRTLGYQETMRAWRHPDRTAIFVGDFIDRGPQQVATVKLVRAMTDTGAAKAILAVLFGGSLLLWLRHYPQSVLGVLLLFSGLELAMVCRDQNRRVDFFVMLMTAGACMAVNTAIGFVVGWIIAAALTWGLFRIEPPANASETPA